MITKIPLLGEYNDYQTKLLQVEKAQELLALAEEVSKKDEDQLMLLKRLLDFAVQLEFATIPLYLQAMWSIKDNNCEVAQSIRNIFQEEMLHMAMVCNMIVGIGGEPKIYDPVNGLKYPTHLPGDVHPELFLFLEGLNDCSLRNFMEIELPDHVVPVLDSETGKPVKLAKLCGSAKSEADHMDKDGEHDHYGKTIGEVYEKIRDLFKALKPEMDTERQLAGPLSWWVMADTYSVNKAIDMIVEQGEGSKVNPNVEGQANLAHFYRFWEVYEQKKIVYENRQYFFQDEMSRPETRNVARIPEGGYKAEDVSSEVQFLLSQFDRTYTELVKLLEDAWAIGGGGQASLVKAIEVMFDLERYAIPLMETPIPGKENKKDDCEDNSPCYGPCFRMVPEYKDWHVLTSCEVYAPAKEVWKLLGDFYNIHVWHPDILSSEPTDEKTAKNEHIRKIKFEGQEPTYEKLISMDKANMRYQYKWHKGEWGEIVQNYQAMIEVVEKEPNKTCTVKWSSTFFYFEDAITQFYHNGYDWLIEKFGGKY